jgi:hypothetical protein
VLSVHATAWQCDGISELRCIASHRPVRAHQYTHLHVFCAHQRVHICVLVLLLLYRYAIQEDWKYVLRFALPIVLVEEILKAIGRHINSKKEAAQREATGNRLAASAPLLTPQLQPAARVVPAVAQQPAQVSAALQ